MANELFYYEMVFLQNMVVKWTVTMLISEDGEGENISQMVEQLKTDSD